MDPLPLLLTADHKVPADFNGVSGEPIKAQMPKKHKRNKYALAVSVLASMTSVLLGYEDGVMSGAIIYIQRDLKISDVKIEILLGTFNFCALVGSAFAGRTSDWIGRRYTIIVVSAIFFVGAILMGFATNYTFLMVGRFVAGIGVGYGLMIAPVYAAEMAPASSRGFLSSFPEIFSNIGVLLGYISNYAFSKLPLKLGWRMMLGIGVVPSIFIGVGVLAMSESPRWLVMQGRLGDAKKVLDRTSDSPEEAQLRLSEIKRAIGLPENCNNDVVSVPHRSHGEGVWKELFLHPTLSVRYILIAGLGIHFFQQASGIDAVGLYSPRIYEKVGIKEVSHKLLATIAVGLSKTLFLMVATFLVDKVGRRVLLLTSAGGQAASLFGLATGLTIIDRYPDQYLVWAVALCIITTLSSVAFFSIGMGPITWVYSSEVFPLRLRAQGCSMGVAVNRVTSGVVLMTFISLYRAITIGGVFYLFTGIAILGWIFFYTFLPETQGRTLEEMEALFETSLGGETP